MDNSVQLEKGRQVMYQEGYQQALKDFGILELLGKLSNFSDSNFDARWLNLAEEELDSLAVFRDLDRFQAQTKPKVAL